MTVSYTPADSSYIFSSIEFENAICPKFIHVGGGFAGYNANEKTLKVTHPNGGETFVVGSDTIITWEGLPPEEKVAIDYSADNGLNWQQVAKETSGLKYVWKDVPEPPSDECLMKVKQLNLEGNDNKIPEIEWERTLGGSYDDIANSVVQSYDGGFVAAGSARSDDGDVKNHSGRTDVWICKLNLDGEFLWEKCYGGAWGDNANAIALTKDGGYITAGTTHSSDFFKIKGYSDVLMVKTDADGDKDWFNTFGGDGYDYGYSIDKEKDYRYIVAGSSSSEDLINQTNKGSFDALAAGFGKSANLIWNKLMGGGSNESAMDIKRTFDGGHIVVGCSQSLDGDVYNNFGQRDFWVVKLDALHNLVWSQNFGGINDDIAYSVQTTFDGGYIVAGTSKSYSKYNSADCMVVKLDAAGNAEWLKTYGGSMDDEARSIIQTPDGGYAFTGWTYSSDSCVSENKGLADVWVVKLDSQGEIIWEKTFGGSDEDYGKCIKLTYDGGFVFCGYTESSDGDVFENKGGKDFWVVKLTPEQSFLQEDISDSVFSVVVPKPLSKNINMGDVLLGSDKDSLVVKFIMNAGDWPFEVDSMYITGPDAAAFSHVSIFPKYSVEAKGSESAEFNFKPIRLGEHFANVIIETQYGSLSKQISGTGIVKRIAILTKEIDFGLVEVGDHKDTLDAVMIKNAGSEPINIYKTRHYWPNEKDFKTLAGAGPFTLQPGDTCRMGLRFEPSEGGLTSGALEFYPDDDGDPAVVYLFGEGYRIAPNISVDSLEFQDLICECSFIDTLKISNTGGEGLNVDNIEIKGAGSIDFLLNYTNQLIIEPDSSAYLPLTFIPHSPGLKEAYIEISSNADNAPLLTIPISAFKDSVNLEPEVLELNLGILCPDEILDTSIVVRNTGTVKNTASAIISDLLESGDNYLNIDTDSYKSLDIRFIGRDSEGVINEKISIIDSICRREKVINIIGEIIDSKIEIEDLSFDALAGSVSEKAIAIKNTSNRDIIINRLSNITIPFEIKGNPFPLMIPAGQSETVTIIFSPVVDSSYNFIGSAIGEPCGLNGDFNINGISSKALANITLPELEAYPGETIEAQIIISDIANIDVSDNISFSAELVFNPSLLAPKQYSSVIESDISAKIFLEDLQVKNKGEKIASVFFETGLGNSEECALELTNIVSSNEFINISAAPGSFRLLEICREGGDRLLEVRREAGIINISPNPANDEIDITYIPVEKGKVEFAIIDILGKTIKTESLGFLNAASDKILTKSINLSGLGAGQYMLVYKSAVYVESASFVIIK